jgi:hypothetical protein
VLEVVELVDMAEVAEVDAELVLVEELDVELLVTLAPVEVM